MSGYSSFVPRQAVQAERHDRDVMPHPSINQHEHARLTSSA